MDDWLEITETFDSTVCEMTNDPAATVQISRDVIARVTQGDPEPQFATFVIESGWSKSKRFWGPELFGSVANEMNAAAEGGGEPIVGYLGHIKDEDDPYLFPEIQLQWVGARLQQIGDKARLAVKAYVLPDTQGLKYLRRGLVKTVSWRGKVAQEMFRDAHNQGVRIKKFAIESIDLSRPRAAGMSARLVGPLTSEMEHEGGNSVKPEEIAALQPNELRAHNPGLVQAIEADARKPLEDQVSEMTATVDATAPTLAEIPSIKKALGLDDDADDVTVLKAAAKFVVDQGKTVRDALLDKVLKSKKLDGDDKNVKLARRLIVGEMREQEFQPTGDSDKDEQTVAEMVNRFIDSSDDLKEIVSEMENAPPALPVSENPRTGDERELKAGFSNSNLRVRALR